MIQLIPVILFLASCSGTLSYTLNGRTENEDARKNSKYIS